MQILNTLGAPYETVNILESELLRQGMKEYSQWPTFPQVYIDGEFYGGCDIMIGEALYICLLWPSLTLLESLLSMSSLVPCPGWQLMQLFLKMSLHLGTHRP